MKAEIVSEIHADDGRICAFLLGRQRLATAYRQTRGQWLVRTDSQESACDDFDAARSFVLTQVPCGHAAFVRRTIVARHHYHGRLAETVPEYRRTG